MDSQSLVNSVLSTHKPQSWNHMTAGTEVQLEELGTSSQEFVSISDKIRRTLPVTVDRVLRVQNPYLFGCYLLKKEEYVKRYGYAIEMELFHATSTTNVASITRNNLDWRRSVRTKFGEGVSFSPDARYANCHCNRNNPAYRAMLVANVLIHSTCTGSHYMKLPTCNADTSTGNAGSVYVKYSDNEFYPTYVAYYNSPPIPRRRYRYF